MTHTKRLLALFLCLLLTGTSTAALAASKTFTTVPTIKATTSKSVKSYDDDSYTVTLSQPGYLTVKLLDENGMEVMTLLDAVEAHSKNTEFTYYTKLPDGSALPVGSYQLSFDLVNQFGVSAKTLLKPLTVKEMGENQLVDYLEAHNAYNSAGISSALADGLITQATADAALESYLEYADESAAAAAAALAAASAAAGSLADASAAAPSSTGSAASSTASSAAAPAVIPTSEVTYTAGTSVTGDEGLLIGVGVSDVATQTDAGFWGLTAEATDAEIWAALTRTMTGVDAGETESAYIYDSPNEGRKKLGTVSGISQGLNVIVQRADGWSLVETFRNEDGAFVRGYIKTNKLRTVEPNQTYGIVIDKAAQTLTVYKDGARLGSCAVTTGLATPKYLHRETPAGEFITVTRRGTYEYYGTGSYTKYTIRINGNYYISEIPTTKKNGTNYSPLLAMLGNKATRGNVCIAHDASTDGGINAEWIWNMTDSNKKVKVLIFDDKPRTDVPQGA